LTRAFALACVAALALATGAIADEPVPSPLKPAVTAPASLDEFMRANEACTAFTNECEICKRSDAGPQCSTPGLACQPKEWRCDPSPAKPQ
jgi:hypothetical protein